MTAEDVAGMIGSCSPGWVRANVPKKLALGRRTVRWYEQDIRQWLEQLRIAGSDA